MASKWYLWNLVALPLRPRPGFHRAWSEYVIGSFGSEEDAVSAAGTFCWREGYENVIVFEVTAEGIAYYRYAVGTLPAKDLENPDPLRRQLELARNCLEAYVEIEKENSKPEPKE